MHSLNIKSQFKVLTQNFKSCSLVNAEGQLLYSKDLNNSLLTTTRLVAFQIVKKYLRPQTQDLFILNDPENGGFHYSKLVFISALTPHLFLIWDEDFQSLNFKIPPTPLFDKGQKNEFVWKALISASPNAEDLESFILFQKYKIDQILKLTELTDNLSTPKTQQFWLKASQEVFEIQFNNKAQGSIESQHKLPTNQNIKLKFTAEEKQNIKLFTLDLTNTHLATDIYAASHIIESGLIKKIIDFYEIGDFFTQSILDKIKIILPPRSIVSKAHPLGLHNFSLQTISVQLCDYLLTSLNNPSRKTHTPFVFNNFLNFSLKFNDIYFNSYLGKTNYCINGIEQLSNMKKISLHKIRKLEDQGQIIFKVIGDEPLTLQIQNTYETDISNFSIKLNSENKYFGTHVINKNDLLEIAWTI